MALASFQTNNIIINRERARERELSIAIRVISRDSVGEKKKEKKGKKDGRLRKGGAATKRIKGAHGEREIE